MLAERTQTSLAAGPSVQCQDAGGRRHAVRPSPARRSRVHRLAAKERTHEDELPGPIIPIDHERWSKVFTLVGEDEDFGRAVVTNENAARCAEADVHAEWRFVNDELLLWVWRGRVDDQLVTILDVAKPLIEAAERYTRAES
jgi:hypothetical protein